MAVLSQRAYARHRGVGLSTVQKAITSGRISLLPDGRIDSDRADQEWETNTHKRGPVIGTRRQPEDDGDGFGAAQYTKARAVREHYQARLAKIEYEEKVGSLVSKDEVKIAQFNIDRQRRDAMLNIADRVCASIAAEVKDILLGAGVPAERADALDTSRIHEILTDEIRKGLNDYADSLVN
ncbi:MAG TPA: hypothetical protein VFA33_06055 [Bryobacteraceae bacterium]|nr:hypothetical protein [Bryobacteraceae bacterium]